MSQHLYQAITELLFCESKNGLFKAQGELESDEPFRVFQGSTAKGSPNNVFQKKLVDNGVLKKSGNTYVFTKDYVFTAPSSAASTILGRNSNGWVEWKNKNGKSLKFL